MHLTELSDANSFLSRSSALLLEAEAENNLILSSALMLARSSATRSPRLSFFVVEKERKIICAALNASERRLLLSTANPAAAEFMGRELALRQTPFRGILGPSAATAAFREGFVAAGGRALQPKGEQRVLKLEAFANATKSAPGIARAAKEKDLRLLLKWSRQFVAESGLDETERESEEVLRRCLEARQLFVWEDNRPVAMAGYGGQTPNGIRVNMVYTDPAARSRGYAGTLVNFLSRRLVADGHRFCFLYVESTNTPANRIYSKIGYKQVGDFMEYR